MKCLIAPNGTKIEFYSSMDELTIRRYTYFQKYLALESGIGSNIESILSRCNKIRAYCEEDKKKDAVQEVENLKEACLSIINGVPYNTLAFACLVATIGGQLAKDVTESGLHTTVEQLTELDILNSQIEDTVSDVKKKLS